MYSNTILYVCIVRTHAQGGVSAVTFQVISQNGGAR